MLYPITFSIPEEKVINYIPQKTKILSDLIPGKIETYIYDNENDYYSEYRKSYFAISTKKSGWDCLRHYEILANGCIPYFYNIKECPKNTLSLFPKKLILEGNLLYDKFKNDNEINILEYNTLLIKLMHYVLHNLTTKKMANYVLSKCNKKIKNILYLSGNTDPDYLRCLTLHGFKELFGTKCHDYPKIPHIYKGNYSNLYGKGISYTNLLDHSLHDDKLDNSLIENIKNKYYDLIIYGSYHRGILYYDLINIIYEPSEIVLLCGEDIHCCNYLTWSEKGHIVFVREL